MKKSALSQWVAICTLPLIFAFTPNHTSSPVDDGIIIKVVPMNHFRAFKLRMSNLQKKPVRISIQDFQGRTIYSEKVIDHNGYRQLINLRNLDNGKYLLQIMHPLESRVGTLELGSRSVKISWTDEDTTNYR